MKIAKEARKRRTKPSKRKRSTTGGLGAQIAARFARRGLNREILELHGFTIKLPDFE